LDRPAREVQFRCSWCGADLSQLISTQWLAGTKQVDISSRDEAFGIETCGQSYE